MCIGFPGKIISINDDNCATIDVGGTKREARLDLVSEEVKLGDYVICHAGFALQKVDYDEAQERLKLLKEVFDGGMF